MLVLELAMDKYRHETEGRNLDNGLVSDILDALLPDYKMETIWGARQTPLGFMLCAGESADSVRDYLTQQNEIDF